MAELNDDQIIKYILTGDMKYLSLLINKYEIFAYKYAYSLLYNHHEAEDIVSESFLKAYEKLDKYNIGTSFKNWFLKIVHNKCIDFLRANKRLVFTEDNNSYEESSENIIINKTIISQALDKLSHDMRAIIVLRYYYSLDYKEICEILDIPIGTLSSRLNRGLKNMRKLIEEG